VGSGACRLPRVTQWAAQGRFPFLALHDAPEPAEGLASVVALHVSPKGLAPPPWSDPRAKPDQGRASRG